MKLPAEPDSGSERRRGAGGKDPARVDEGGGSDAKAADPKAADAKAAVVSLRDITKMAALHLYTIGLNVQHLSPAACGAMLRAITYASPSHLQPHPLWPTGHQ